MLLTGFNRRFSPHARHIHQLIRERSNPMILNYRMNAGYIPLDHWVHTEEGGGRNRGEACHIYDLFTYLTGSTVKDISAKTVIPTTGYYSRQDNFIATLTFDDGSVATLTYTSLGSRNHPKEQLEVYVDGKVISLDDYKNIIITSGKSKNVKTKIPEKGWKEEILAFATAIREGGEWPIPLWQQIQATQIALQVEYYLNGGHKI